MNCSRCHGLMVREHFLDFESTYGHMWASGHRCMNCGNVHDPVIEQHRFAKTQPALAPPNNEVTYKKNELPNEAHTEVMRAA